MREMFYLFLAGLISGIVGGMGMGGGTLLIPILTIFLSFPQKSAQGVNLLVFIPMSIVALIIHIKNRLVDFKIGVPVILSGMSFSLLGSFLANKTPNDNLRLYFGMFLLAIGVFQGIQTIFLLKKDNRQKACSTFKFRIYLK